LTLYELITPALEGGIMGEREREQRLQIMRTAEEFQALDEWRFACRMPSRAAAVRELLKRGLAAEGFSQAKPGRKSESYYGMIDPDTPARTPTTAK
jgi:hypothetical protein